MVLLFHAGAPFLPGGFVGVDVFFVISGFLITGMLVRQSFEAGRIDLADFYARRVRRILPAATLVLLVTVFCTWLILPRTRWESIGEEAVGSALYFVNWIFAANTDYLNADSAESPLQHFWTLAVEEQFYIVWPLLLVLLLLIVRWLAHSPHLPQSPSMHQVRTRRLVEVGVILMVLPSLAWSIYYTSAEPAAAYFVSTTRLWELGVGAAIAVWAGHLSRLPELMGRCLQIGGLIAIVVAGLTFSSETVFPGYAALLPVLGAAAVIVGGMAGRDVGGPAQLLNTAPMRWVGDLSYSLYLWHWPLLVFATYLMGEDLRFRYGLLVVLFAFIPAWMSYTYVETPFRDWTLVKESVSRALRAGAALMAVSVLAGLALLVSLGSLFGSYSRGLEGPAGAELLAQDHAEGRVVDQAGDFVPAVEEAADDNPGLFDLGCHQEESHYEVVPCVFGDEDSDYVVALVGDSHAAQWLPALEPIAEEQSWRLESYTKSSCPYNGVALELRGSFYEECYVWGQALTEELTGAGAPDHVVTSASRYSSAEEVGDGAATGGVSSGYVSAWGELEKRGVPVTVILDTPRTDMNSPECVAENLLTLTACAVDKETALTNSGYPALETAAEEAGIEPVDMTDMICPEKECPPIIGGVLVYRDSNHITATYSATLSGVLETELRNHGALRFSD